MDTKATVVGSPKAGSSREGSPEPRLRKFHNGWTKEQEKLMADWADIAMCYRWLHNYGEGLYKNKNLGMSIPVVILSTVTGSSSLALDTYFGSDQEMKRYANITIGALSLIAGLLQTLSNLFRFAQLSEAHRVASIAWGKFQRQIAVELRLHPNERIDSMDFLKICRTEIDRLIEQSPPIPDVAIAEFEKKFGNIKDIKKPEICNQLEHTVIFEDSESRLKKMAADASLMLRHKKNLLKEMVMPEFERKISSTVEARVESERRKLESKLETEVEARLEEIKAAYDETVANATAPVAPIDSAKARGRQRFDFGKTATAGGIELASRPPATARSASRSFATGRQMSIAGSTPIVDPLGALEAGTKNTVVQPEKK